MDSEKKYGFPFLPPPPRIMETPSATFLELKEKKNVAALASDSADFFPLNRRLTNFLKTPPPPPAPLETQLFFFFLL